MEFEARAESLSNINNNKLIAIRWSVCSVIQVVTLVIFVLLVATETTNNFESIFLFLPVSKCCEIKIVQVDVTKLTRKTSSPFFRSVFRSV